MTDIFFKNSWAILQNPHCPGTRSHHAWNVWLRVVKSGMIGEVDHTDAPGKEFEKPASRCGSYNGRSAPYYPRIYRESRSIGTENLI